MDKGENGMLSKREIEDGFAEVGKKMTPKESADLFGKLDANGDG